MTPSAQHRTRRRAFVAALSTAAFAAAGIGVGSTVAAWVDDSFFQATATASSFDIWGRFNDQSNWYDLGLPGDPDSFVVPILVGEYLNVQPSHGYAGDVYLCNAGDVDGVITAAVLSETQPDRTPWNHLVVPSSIQVEGIDVGTVIPAGSCPSDPNQHSTPVANDVYGIIRFTTVDDFTGLYGDDSRILILITVQSVSP